MFLSCLEQCSTSAITDHGGAHKLCVMELVKGTDEMTMTAHQRWEFTLFCSKAILLCLRTIECKSLSLKMRRCKTYDKYEVCSPLYLEMYQLYLLCCNL